jgi:ribosome-binding factor A
MNLIHHHYFPLVYIASYLCLIIHIVDSFDVSWIASPIDKLIPIKHYLTTGNSPVKSIGLFASRDSIYTRRVGSRGGGQPNEIKSKRQERFGQFVSYELGRIIHSGLIKGRDVEQINDNLRQRISVVKSDVSPDLRQARVYVSIRSSSPSSLMKRGSIESFTDPRVDDSQGTTVTVPTNSNDFSSTGSNVPPSTLSTPTTSSAVDKRQAYSWLVRNTKSLRHTLAQKMSHMKICPTITFVQVDVAAAVDVMYLIDQAVSAGKKRNDLPFQQLASSGEINWDEWDDEDDDDDEAEGQLDILDEDFFKPSPR